MRIGRTILARELILFASVALLFVSLLSGCLPLSGQRPACTPAERDAFFPTAVDILIAWQRTVADMPRSPHAFDFEAQLQRLNAARIKAEGAKAPTCLHDRVASLVHSMRDVTDGYADLAAGKPEYATRLLISDGESRANQALTAILTEYALTATPGD